MSAAAWRESQGLAPAGADRATLPRWPSETAFHLDVVRWWRALNVLDGTLLFHVPNGGKRRLIEAAILQGMGVESGVADLVAMLPGGRVGWVELKHIDGSLSPAQKAFRARCETLGHSWFEARDFDQVVAALAALQVRYIETPEALKIRFAGRDR